MGHSRKFKDYDRMWPNLVGSAQLGRVGQAMLPHMNRWHRPVEQWDQRSIMFAVYEAADFLEWQKFRVSIKGKSTKEKLVHLDILYVAKCVDNPFPEGRLWKIRIDNYIGALVRGGQLSKDSYKVQK